ncbi:MAG: DUF1289 domain-containing protein [Actinobacteria bacterium]|nr:DUF1289 domain-containing protein [Actinomycetota bacterium]
MNTGPTTSSASPCIGVCRLEPGTLSCEGCSRTLAEISEWRDATEARRRDILEAAASRRAAGQRQEATPGKA